MKNRPNLPSWKVLAATLAAALATGVAQAVAASGLDAEAIIVAASSALATLLIGYVVPERNPSQSALDAAGR